MNKHLCTTLQMTEIRHVEEKEVLLHQLSILQADSEELGVENSALATVLLGGIKESFSSICNTSSSNLNSNSNSNLNLNAKSAFPKPFPQSTSLSTTLSSSSLPTIYSTPQPVPSSSATFSMSHPPTERIANGESWEVSRSLCGDFHKIADRTHDHQKCDSARRPLTSTSTTATAPAEYNNMESVGLSSGPCIFSPRQPCRSRKITAATESLLELSGLMEEVVMKAKPQHELQMRYVRMYVCMYVCTLIHAPCLLSLSTHLEGYFSHRTVLDVVTYWSYSFRIFCTGVLLSAISRLLQKMVSHASSPI